MRVLLYLSLSSCMYVCISTLELATDGSASQPANSERLSLNFHMCLSCSESLVLSLSLSISLGLFLFGSLGRYHSVASLWFPFFFFFGPPLQVPTTLATETKRTVQLVYSLSQRPKQSRVDERSESELAKEPSKERKGKARKGKARKGKRSEAERREGKQRARDREIVNYFLHSRVGYRKR